MSGMCLSVVGENLTPAEINQSINSYGGIGTATVDQIGVVESCVLSGFCISQGQYAADPCCFEVVENIGEVCAIVLHNCETGVIEDWKPFGEISDSLYCDEDGVVCFKLSCWGCAGACEKAKPQTEELSCDPCELYCQLKRKLTVLSCQPRVKSRSKASVGSVTYDNPSLDALRMEMQQAWKDCCRLQGQPSRRWVSRYYPGRTGH